MFELKAVVSVFASTALFMLESHGSIESHGFIA
jgi:hypothetical protein